MSKGKQQAQGLDSTLPFPVFADGLSDVTILPRA